MRKLLLLFTLLSLAVSAQATTRYVSQSGGVFSGGTACNGQTAISVSTFNSTTLAAGDTTYLCGTITSQVAPHNGGSSGNPVLIQWDTGASVQVCNTSSGTIYINGLSYVTLDLGGNTTAVECPNNGIGLGTAVNAVGISGNGNGWNNVEIRNGTIGPMFVYSGTTNSGFNSMCVNGSNANSTYVHNVAITGCAEGLEIDPTSNSTDQFSYMTIDSSVGRTLNYASANGNNIALNGSYHNNDVNYTSVWVVPGDYQHYEALHAYVTSGSGAQDHIPNFGLYNNYFHGSSPSTSNAGNTALIFFGTGQDVCPATSYISGNIYNNLIVDTGNSSTGFSQGSLGGYFYMQDCQVAMNIYNNTVIAPNGPSNACFSYVSTSSGTSTDLVTFKNNICDGMHWAYRFDALTQFVASNNDFYNIGSGHWAIGGSTYNTLAAWQTQTSQDANSITTIPGLTGTYTISGTSSAVYQTGVNLTSLGITPLDTGAPQTMGESGACGTGCIARSSSVAWDMGAYPYASGNPQAATPTFSPAGGPQVSAVNVTVSTTSPGAIMCIGINTTPATNGTTGCTSGTLYIGPISVNGTETINAVAGGTGYLDSSVGSATYTLPVPPAVNLFAGTLQATGSAVLVN